MKSLEEREVSGRMGSGLRVRLLLGWRDQQLRPSDSRGSGVPKGAVSSIVNKRYKASSTVTQEKGRRATS